MRFVTCFFVLMEMFCMAGNGNNYLAAEPTATVIELTQENSQPTLDSAHLLVVDVYAEWCTPCKRLKPIFNELNTEYGTQYQFAKVNAEDNESFAERFQITGFPTILFIKDGEEVGRWVGFMKKEQFLENLKKYFTQIK